MTSVLRLSLAEWWHSKSFPIAVAFIVAAAFVGEIFVPANLDPGMAGPARAQWAYGAAFLLFLFYLPSFAAELGAAQVARNHRLWRKAMGQSDVGYFAALCSTGFLVAASIAGALFAVVAIGGVADQSLVSKLQAAVLTALAFCIPLPLAVGLAQHVSASVAFFFSFGISIAGLYAPATAEFARNGSTVEGREQWLAEMVMALVPQMRIGDQAERVTFGWPAAAITDFFFAIGYLVAWVAVSLCVGYVLFRAKKV